MSPEQLRELHHEAEKIVKRTLQDQGKKLSAYSWATIRYFAREYLAAHPELIAQARARVHNSQVVNSGPGTDPQRELLCTNRARNGGRE